MPPIPEFVRQYTFEDLASQKVPWRRASWENVLSGHERLLEDLTAHVAENGGILRSFVREQSGGEPVDLFLAAMAWGWGTVGYGPSRVAAILQQPDAASNLRRIIETARIEGAGPGWTALLADYKIPGLGMAFGTKLLYFAAFTTGLSPQPLILDARVRKALQTAAPGTVPGAGATVWRADYVRYLELAGAWAADATWAQPADVVELALFQEGGGHRPDPTADSTDPDAHP